MEFSRSRNRNVYLLLSVFTGLVVLLLLGIAAYLRLSDQHVVAGVRAFDAALGGLTKDEAAGQLASRFEEYSRSPFVIRHQAREWNTTPAEMGIRLDVEASADAAYQVGRGGSVPEQLFAQLGARLNGFSVAPVVYLDDAAANALLKRIASDVDKPPQNADLSLDRNGAVQFSPAQDGLHLDSDATLARLESSLGENRPRELELAVVSVPPTLSDAQLRTLEGVRARLASQPLILEYQGQSLTIDAKSLAALIKVVPGVSGGGSNDGSEGPSIRVDKEAILAHARDLGVRAARDPLDARMERKGNTFVVIEDKLGLRLNEDATLARIWQQLPTGDRRVALVPQDVAPRLTAKDIEPVLSLAQEIVSRPVVLSYAGKSWSVAPEKLVELISFDKKVVDGKTTVSLLLDDTAFLPLADRIANELNQKPRNAEFRVKGANNEVVATRESLDGWTVKVEETARAIGKALLAGKHELEPVVQVTPAAIRSADREKIDKGTVWMSSSTTYANSVLGKVHNIELAASRLDGILVAPGEVFSFNEALGPTTRAAGFQTAWGITMNGSTPETVPSEGGGICQVVTTLFHSVYWTGLKVEERWPHAYWIWKYGQPPRGMTGLDATVDSATVDFQFRNTTPNWIAIRSWTAGQQVYFQILGVDPGWTVKSEGPIITNVKPADPTVIRRNEPTLPVGRELQVEGAVDGFDTKIVRTVFDKDGKQIDKLEVVSHYSPARNVILVGGPKETPTPTVTPTPQPQPTATPLPPAATPAPGAPRTPAPQPAATPAGLPQAAGFTGPGPQPTPKR